MSKYLEYFDGAFDSTVADKLKPENKPYVAYSKTVGVVYTKIPNYLCLEPIDSNNQLALFKLGDYSNIQYSFDKSNWSDFTTDPTNPLNLTYISVDKPIYLRGNNPNGILNEKLVVGCKLSGRGKYNVSGDATTLLSEEGNIKDLTPYGEQSLASLFGLFHEEISGQLIDISGVDVVDSSKLILPATTLTKDCYAYMFYNCTSLTTTPELPATTLAERCYSYMFQDCTSLTTAPELPATKLAESCYINMFGDCTSLTTAPELPATTLAAECYDSMFWNCNSLGHIKCLATDISAKDCTYNWLANVSPTGTFVKDPNKYWSTGASGIPEGWTVEDAEL